MPRRSGGGMEDDDCGPAWPRPLALGAVYCITPMSEAMARAVALHNQPEPVQRWELPAPMRPELGMRCCITCGLSFHPESEGQVRCLECEAEMEGLDAAERACHEGDLYERWLVRILARFRAASAC